MGGGTHVMVYELGICLPNGLIKRKKKPSDMGPILVKKSLDGSLISPKKDKQNLEK